MALSFEQFALSVENGMTPSNPNDWYLGIEQAFISSMWDNTTSIRTVQEQNIDIIHEDYYKDFAFTPIEVWVNTVVGQSSTGYNSGRDFIQLIF